MAVTMVKGNPASKGIGIGKAFVYKETGNSNEFMGRKIPEAEVENETRRFAGALKVTEKELEAAKDKASKNLEEKELQLFEAYKMMLHDLIFQDMVLKNIRKQQLCVEAPVLDAVDQIKAMFLAINNEYMKQRVCFHQKQRKLSS